MKQYRIVLDNPKVVDDTSNNTSQIDISKCNIKLSKTSKAYDGKAFKPTVKVTYKKKTLKNLKIRSKGFSALRSILVFGFVYRFFVPLTVVKPTNIICEKYLEHKKAKQEQMQANKVA